MDADRFDQLIRTLSAASPRRGLLRRFAALPLAGLLATHLDDEGEARRRRQRRKARHDPGSDKKNRKGKRKGKHRKKKHKKREACDVCANGCPFTSVQAAIDDAAAGDTITICAGAYTLTETIRIGKDVTIVGAGRGSDPGANTILDGNDATQVLFVSAGTVVALEALRITGGNNLAGGGVENNGGTLTLADCTISGNSANFGGGILNLGTLRLNGGAVTGNTADDGGGIFNGSETMLTLSGGTVSGNETGRLGGGVYNDGTVTLEAGATVTDNHADSDGGGIYNNGYLGGGTSTCMGGSDVSGNTAGDPPVPNDCVTVSGGDCGAC